MCVKGIRTTLLDSEQTHLPSDSYIPLRKGIRNDVDPENLVKVCILVSNLNRRPGYKNERMQYPMTYLRYIVRPGLIITFTCNIKWSEITRELLAGQSASDRYDIIARNFQLKIDTTYSTQSFRYLETPGPMCRPLSGRRMGCHTPTFSSGF